MRVALDFPYKIVCNFSLDFLTDLCIENFFKKVVLGLLAHVTPSIFFSSIPRSEALVSIDIVFRTAVLPKLFDIRFSYKHCKFSRACLLVRDGFENRDKVYYQHKLGIKWKFHHISLWKRLVSKTKHSKTKTEARSTQNSKTRHPNLENEAPKTRNHCRLKNYNLSLAWRKPNRVQACNGCVRTSKRPQIHPKVIF